MNSIKIFLFLTLLLTSCITKKDSIENKQEMNNSLVFVVLKIQKDSITSKNNIELVSKKVVEGKLKHQKNNFSIMENYLTIYSYDNNRLTDSVSIEHPLYKHLEYLNSNNTFAAKDTILDTAEFFVRLQTPVKRGKIEVVEKLKNKNKTELTVIKL